MTFLVVFLVISFALLVFGGIFINDGAELELAGSILCFFGIIVLVALVFVVAPRTLHTGSPDVSINAGEYQVAFVYIAGDNVSVGVEKKDNGFGEGLHLFLYQFSRSAFEGEIRVNSKKLTVIESGEFKKLLLE